MELEIITASGAAAGKVAASETVFGAEYNEALVHQVVVAYLAASRSGTSAQKTRAEVSGSNKKPWRQKGLGRARAGSTRGPLWRKGGVTFASKTRDYSQKVNRKMYRGAMRSILSELLRQDRVRIVDGLTLDAPKTKLLAALLARLGLTDVLVLTESVDPSLALASRNLPNVSVCPAGAVEPVSLIGFENVLMTTGALKLVESRLS